MLRKDCLNHDRGCSAEMDFRRRLLLSAAGLLAVAVPIVSGLVDATQTHAQSQAQNTAAIEPGYEVASVKPNKAGSDQSRLIFPPDGMAATNVTLQMFIRAAYGVQDYQISGAPNWLKSEKYDIEAKMNGSVADELQKLSPDQRTLKRNRMLQVLLAERFKLSLHRETKELPVYALEVVTKGPKLQPAKAGETYPDGIKNPDGSLMGANIMSAEEGKLVGQGTPVARLVEELSSSYYLHRTVLDKTGLRDKYDFTLQWAPEENQAAIFAAVQEQLGLRLDPQTAPVEVLVVDHAEKPSEN